MEYYGLVLPERLFILKERKTKQFVKKNRFLRNQLDLQKTSTYKKRVRFTTNDQILGSWITHETNYFIKEEGHDHRKVTKLVMSL